MTMTVPDNMGATLGSSPGSSKLKHVTTGDMKWGQVRDTGTIYCAHTHIYIYMWVVIVQQCTMGLFIMHTLKNIYIYDIWAVKAQHCTTLPH